MIQNKVLDFGNMEISELFIKIVIPTLLGMVSSIIVTITDGFYVGRYAGSDALAAVNISSPLFLVATGCALMFGVGCSVIAATYLSHSKFKLANTSITQALLISIILFFILSFIITVYPERTAYFLGTTSRLLPLVKTYILILTPGLIFSMIVNIGLFVIRLDGAPNYAMLCSFVPAFINILADYILVGKMGEGIRGAVWATSGSFFIGGIMVLVYLFFFTKKIQLQFLKMNFKSTIWAFHNIYQMCKLGFSGLLSELAIALMALIGNAVFLYYLGEDGIAAYSVVCYYFPVIFMINNAIAQSAQPIISYNLGISKLDRVLKTQKIALYTALGFSLILTLSMLFLSSQMVGLFLNTNCKAYNLAVKGIPYFSIGIVFFAFNIIYVGFFQSIYQTKTATLITLMRGYLFLILSFVVLPYLWNIKGIWLAIPTAELLTSLILIRRLHTSKSKVIKI
jgi:Na+-driven multidrug efflux pump